MASEVECNEVASQESLHKSLSREVDDLARLDECLATLFQRSSWLHHSIFLHISIEDVSNSKNIIVASEFACNIANSSLFF